MKMKVSEKEIEHFKKVLARFGNDTVCRCSKCGRTVYLTFENGLRNGWSPCCDGIVMPIIYHQADIDKAVGNIVSSAKKQAIVKVN